ncbi:MAG: glycosyltransferase family 4 protein [Cyanobacteria bacterium K_DeepCast_35m_m1_288]|nr:glycosyltransferase family 4 protein [Cyanobacteria bacterium K_DeepCast_35m_m1_288]
MSTATNRSVAPARRLLFVCYPDTNNTIGGVKQIYRQVELLHLQGWNAHVLQEQPGFRPDWFASGAPVLDLASYVASGPSAERDLIVLPETWLTNMPNYLPGIPKVIFNQNAFYTFGLEGRCEVNTLELYQHPDLRGVVTVSEDSRQLLVRGCGVAAEHCHLVLNGIDPTLFHPPAIKLKRIVFMGRKHADHLRKVTLMAGRRPALARYSFKELPSLNHHEMARELREALVFLSGGHPEGFGLPLAEAIASGCLVVGYHGLGGRDFALPHMRAVEFGDLLGFVEEIEHELVRFETNPEEIIQERCRASQQILSRYSPEQELEVSIKTWSTIEKNISQHG